MDEPRRGWTRGLETGCHPVRISAYSGEPRHGPGDPSMMQFEEIPTILDWPKRLCGFLRTRRPIFKIRDDGMWVSRLKDVAP